MTYLPSKIEAHAQVRIRVGVGAPAREGTSMLKVVHEENQPWQVPAAVGGSLLDELARDGARQMLAAALPAETAAYVEAHRHEVDEDGHRLVVRNGFHDPREVATAAGSVPVRQPRVNDKRIDEETGERKRFSSTILPAWARKSRRAWPRCSRCSTCTASPPATSCPHWSSSSAPPRACPRRLSPDSRRSGKTTRRRSATGRWPTPTTCTCGSTGSTSRSASSRTRCACW